MHIKKITISNFRSFRQQGEIKTFSDHTNAVVGRNGSGKSNLFSAVEFCLLAPRFLHLRQVRIELALTSIEPLDGLAC
jgi:structural maintenance of chromosome 3 (chondroitin sulfate proteoglycan 6)